MALADYTAVEQAAGRPLTSEEVSRVIGLLEIASDAVTVAAGGYRFAPGAYTVSRIVTRRIVHLPAEVATVAQVRALDPEDGTVTTLTGWTLRRSTLYDVDACQVEVDFTSTAQVPPAVEAIVAGIVAATINAPGVGVASQGAGPFQVSYADSSGRVWLSASDRIVLRCYRPVRPAKALL